MVEKIVASFSAPSDLVVLLTDIPSVRSDDPAGGAPAAGERGLGQVVAVVENLGRRARVVPATARDRRASLTAAADGEPSVSGGADLVIATLSPHQEPDRGIVGACADLLRPGGVLAVLTHTGHRGERLVDPTAAIVTATQDADLLYLQHIVVLPAGPSETATVPGTGRVTGGHPSPPDRDRRRCSRHRRVHADLLIFLHTGTTAAASELAGPR